MSIRTERVAALIKKELSEVLAREIDTGDYGLVTITDVIMTADLKIAKIYVSFFGTAKTEEECLAFLNEHEKKLRMTVGSTVRLKFTPELRFFFDATLDKVQRIEELLREDSKRRSGGE